jgi:hypothetical protein
MKRENKKKLPKSGMKVWGHKSHMSHFQPRSKLVDEKKLLTWIQRWLKGVKQ